VAAQLRGNIAAGPEQGKVLETSSRERIVRAAAQLFAMKGYHATGIAELLEATGLSRGTLYYHVENKETLLFEISRDQVNHMNSVAAEIMECGGSAVDRLRRLARSLLRNISDHHAEWVVFFREFNVLVGDHRDEILQARNSYESTWRRVLEEGIQAGEFVGVSPLHVKGILGMFNYTYLWLDPSGALKAEEVADSFVDLLLDGLRKRG
jgi:AcrR family transcriptional regulator